MKAFLILQDGTIFEGDSIGSKNSSIGEIVFNTSMGGYMEILTDNSYYGQIVVQTYPIIGGYGASEKYLVNTAPKLNGYIVREMCEGSNFAMQEELAQYLERQNITGLCGIDTRQLTRHIRDNGSMAAMISCDKKNIEEKIKLLKEYKIKDAQSNTSVKEIEVLNEGGKKRVAVIDMGNFTFESELLKRDFCIIKMPYSVSFEQIKKYRANGVIVSDGAGNPAENKNILQVIKKLFEERMPMLGIGLGHNLMAAANGASNVKAKYGHHGSNQPVKDLKSNKTFMTNQSHSYYVAKKSLSGGNLEETFININDKTNEGADYKNAPAFSVQFIPSDASVPRCASEIFDRFEQLAAKTHNAK